MMPLLRSLLPGRPAVRAYTLALGLAPGLALSTGGTRATFVGTRAGEFAARPRAVERSIARVPGRPPAADSVVDFRLSDQFGRVHDAATYRGRALLLVGAGHGGRMAGTAWVGALRGLQGDAAGALALPVVAVADLRGVPRLLRRLVRGRFPADRAQAVLLDWDGTLARRFGFAGDACTILLVGPTGRLHAQTSPTGVDAAVDTVRARALLREAAALSSTALRPSARAGPLP